MAGHTPSGYPETVELLIQEFTKYPGIGRKGAERLVLHTLKLPVDEVQKFVTVMKEAVTKTRFCALCHSLTDKDICDVCSDPKRKPNLVCVVESFRDVIQIEKAGFYGGKYHVLGGHISPLDGVHADDLTINSLLKRVELGDIEEVILALNPNTDGDVTSMHIAQLLEPYPIIVSQMARGLPLGGDLEFADALTIAKSLEHRTKYSC